MRPVAAIALMLVAIPAFAEWGQFEYDFEANTKTWQELQTQLPAYPKPENLVPVEVSAATSNRYFVDYPSVSLGEDGVVRYTVVVKSPAGAENVSFEGLRCTTGERKLYAFGHGGGEWSRNRYARWEPIQARQAVSYHRELFFHYMCTVDTVGDLKKIQDALKQGGVRRGGD